MRLGEAAKQLNVSTGSVRNYCDNGELTLKDSTDAEVLSGTTVKKGSELTVVTTPAEGGNREIRIACDEATDVTIVSLSGKLCHKTTVKGHAAIALPAGIYTVTMKQGSTQATKKLLVK